MRRSRTSTTTSRREPWLSASDPFETDAVEHVILGTDGSDDAEGARRWALGIARFWDARVTVVCAFDSPRSFRKRASMILPEVRNELEAEAREIVAEVVAFLESAGVEAEGVAYEGNMADAILDLAERDRPDVIVVSAASNEHGARDYLVSSAAERIVRHSPVSVFVIK